MPRRHPVPSHLVVALVSIVVLLVAACAPATTPPPSGSPTPAIKLNVGLGYIPSVQFAAFYRADQAGYYTAEGLTVAF